MNSRKSILVRGCTGGLFITVDDSIGSEELNDRVMERIRRVGPEIRGESIILEVDKRSMDSDALQSFQMRLNQEFGMSVQQLISKSDETREAAKELRIRSAPVFTTGRDPQADTVSVPYTLRSGEFKRNPRGNILILGDVNPGAEVSASGDVIVMGTLWGVATAGALGDETAVVIALNMQATQLRIAGHYAYARSSNNSKKEKGLHPEVALLENGEIVVRNFIEFNLLEREVKRSWGGSSS